MTLEVETSESSRDRQMTAEICFADPDDMKPAVADLVELGFTVEQLDWVGPELDDAHVCVLAHHAVSELEEDLLDRVTGIVGARGYVVEAGDAAGMAAGMVSKSQDAEAVRRERRARERKQP